jgi:hypothetical protein
LINFFTFHISMFFSASFACGADMVVIGERAALRLCRELLSVTGSRNSSFESGLIGKFRHGKKEGLLTTESLALRLAWVV